MSTRVLLPLYVALVLLVQVCTMCPAPVLDANNETQLIFFTPMKSVTNDTLSSCDKSVQHLILENLGIEEVSSNAFEDFYNLKYLSLANNNISVLSSVLLDYKRALETFKINNNRLERIEEGTFKHLDRVRYIEIQVNNISYIAPEVFPKNLRLLHTVNASYNALTYMEPWAYLPETYPNDNDDVTFDLKYNNIAEFRNSVNWTYDLIEPFEYDIQMSFNNITTQLTDIKTQYHPDFQGNDLTEFLSFRINLTHNPFFCDCNLYPFAEQIQNQLFFLFYQTDEYRYLCSTPDALRGMDFLHEVPLDKFVCNVTEDCPVGCRCQEQPYHGHLLVDCSLMGGYTGTRMYRLPLKLPAPKQGKISLHLDGHYITMLEPRDYLPQLVNLTLGWNKLTYLEPNALKNMSNLKYLDISHNRLSYLPKDMQYFTTEKVRIESNPFVCDCNMTWMDVWVSLYPSAAAYHVQCSEEDGDRYYIRDISSKLQCDYSLIITIVVVVVGVLIALIIVAVITAHRCPYETKVMLFRLFGVHPADKYRIDSEETRQFDIYLSHYEHDLQARQWVRSKFLRKLEENQKRKYKVFYSERDPIGGTGKYDELLTNMRQSRRIVFILTNEFFEDENNIWEADQAEIEHRSCDKSHGRVIYILWNESIREKIKSEPWKSRIEGKRVLCPDEKLFWSKMRYELPIKLLPQENTENPRNWAERCLDLEITEDLKNNKVNNWAERCLELEITEDLKNNKTNNWAERCQNLKIEEDI